MNKKQRIILSIGILLVIVNGLFPPYEGELRLKGDNLKNYMGYHFLFAPPTERDVYEAVLGRRASNTISQRRLSMFSSHIITSRVWVQVVTVVVATLGLLFLVAGKDNKGSSKKRDSQDFKKLFDANRLFTLLCLHSYTHSRFFTEQAHTTNHKHLTRG